MSSRSGRIIKDISLNYTFQIADEKNSRQKRSEDYFELRIDIFDMICNEYMM